MKVRRGLTLTYGIITLTGFINASVVRSAERACTVPSIQSAAPRDTTITLAEQQSQPAPHCKVGGYVTTTNPGPNRVNFRLQLPEKKDWNERYYFIGMGGSAGYVPTDSQIPSGNPLIKGWAVAGTDTGHQGYMLNWDFMQDPAKAMDHSVRGGHVTAVATQQITKAYYGVDKMYRYHVGCSGGGRMGRTALVRHPEDYDGILIGAAAPYTGTLLLLFAAQQAQREPGAWIPPAKLAFVDQEVTAACDKTDGVEDGVVWNNSICHYDVAELACKAGDQPDCLTAPQVRTLKAILAGPRDAQGRQITEPMPITNITALAFWLGMVPPPWSMTAGSMEETMRTSNAALTLGASMGRGFFGPDFDIAKFDMTDKAQLVAWDKRAKELDFSYYSDVVDLSFVRKAGTKAMFYNGIGDPCCNAETLLKDYRAHLRATPGGTDILSLYLIPGMGHCGGGTGPADAPDQLLNELVSWVEGGRKPGPVVAHRGDERATYQFPTPGVAPLGMGTAPVGSPRDFLLCPAPSYAAFDPRMAGKPGAIEDAANWTCHAPKPGDARQY